MVKLGCFSEMYIKFQLFCSGALYLRSETCLECIIRHICSKHKLLILSCLSDFMTCSVRFNIQSEGSISKLWNIVER